MELAAADSDHLLCLLVRRHANVGDVFVMGRTDMDIVEEIELKEGTSLS